jgi:ClpP class serine protease
MKKDSQYQGILPFQNTEWAITKDSLSEILAMSNESFEAFFDVGDRDKRELKVENGVGHIQVHGPLFKYSNILTLIGIGTSYEVLTNQFKAALADPAVKRIALDVDSPGGQVSGTNKFCDLIFESRGQKPIDAIVSGDCMSAAYWVASACDHIYATDETDGFGSIGVVFTVSKSDSSDYVITSSNAPNKRPDPGTAQGQAYYKSLIDKFAEIFEERVARNRGVDIATVRSDFGKGGILLAKDAIKVGMIDEIKENGGNTMNLESLKKDHPDLVQALTEEVKQAVVSEKQAEIDALQAKITELESRVPEQQGAQDPELPPEAKAQLDAYRQRVESLEKENLQAKLTGCNDEQKSMLMGFYGKLGNDEILAMGKEIARLHAVVEKLGGPQGSGEAPPKSDDFEAKVKAKAEELKKENSNMTDYEAFIEAHKLVS